MALKNKQKNGSRYKKGSALVFSLIVLSLLLTMALSISTVSGTNQKSVSATRKSVVSFQLADTGSEIALYEFYKGCGGNGCQTVNDLNTSPNNVDGRLKDRCLDGVFTVDMGVDGGTAELIFSKDDGTGNPVEIIDCTDASLSPSGGSAIQSMKVVGQYSGTVRAIEVSL